MKKILLIEDNLTIIKGLEYYLQNEGFCIKSKTNIKEAKSDLENNKYDLVILDIFLPDGNGFELCRYIKQEYSDTPVIFLTAKDEEKDVVLGLDLGADDYIIKPFRTRELISRINTILRRYNKSNNILTYKYITVDIDKNIIYKNGKEIILTALEYKILLMLFNNMGKIITRQQILEKIWDIAGNFVNDNTLTVYIKRIREKLEDDPTKQEIIKTIRGIGYRVGE